MILIFFVVAAILLLLMLLLLGAGKGESLRRSLRSRARIIGKRTVSVWRFGDIKVLGRERLQEISNHKLAFRDWLLKKGLLDLEEQFRARYLRQRVINTNIVTDQGDALIADLMQQTPTQTKVDETNGFIAVGTGWTGTTPKQNEIVNTPTGSPEVMDATYPKTEGTFGNANDNVVQYRVTFEVGELNEVGIDEAGLGNNAVEASGDNLAYGQIAPAVDVSTSDTLQVDWELTVLGA